MLRQILVVGGSVLVLKLVYDKFIAASVPDRVLVEALDLDTDDVALAVLVGLAAPVIEPMIRKVVPN